MPSSAHSGTDLFTRCPGTHTHTYSRAHTQRYNGLHYMEESIKNYQMHLTRTVLDAKHTAEIMRVKAQWAAEEALTKRVDGMLDLPEMIARSFSRGAGSRSSSADPSFASPMTSRRRSMRISKSQPTSPVRNLKDD